MKYVVLLGIAVRGNLASRAGIVARLGFYLVILFVFGRLWAAVGDGTARAGVGGVALLWYLAFTELVTLATPLLYLEIEEEVRRGDLAYRLARPLDYLVAKLAEGTGELLVRFLSLATAGLAGAWIFAGGLPADPAGILLALPVAFLAALVCLVIQAGVGLSAFWLHDAAPVYWIVQKFLFVFGGLLFPLTIYPDWLRRVSEATPFAALIHGVGRIVYEADAAVAAWAALRIAGWGLVLLALVAWLYRRGLRILDLNGG